MCERRRLNQFQLRRHGARHAFKNHVGRQFLRIGILRLRDLVLVQVAGARGKFRIASENPRRLGVGRRIPDRHPDEFAIIGMYLCQPQALATPLGLPVLTGTTPRRQIQISDAFGSHPKSPGNQAHFYMRVSRDTVEQGYPYSIKDGEESAAEDAPAL
jgi:hypothetical protein